MREPLARHGRTRIRSRRWSVPAALVVAVALVIAGTMYWTRPQPSHPNASGQEKTSALRQSPTGQDINSDLRRSSVPSAKADTPQAKAQAAVADMTLEEQVGQLIMAPLNAGTDPSALRNLITDQHVGSVLIIGNWRNGTDGVRLSTDALQGYAPENNKLIMATDQEGGLVQHLKGNGFDTIPSATQQGLMSADQLRASAGVWGTQLVTAGINVDLAPVMDTVTTDRASNAPIGALDRDFGLDADGNAEHGTAFVRGMHDAGVETSIKHYPGLGAVTGNTDFTADGILDTTTTLGGSSIGAFTQVIDEADPGMVMMSLATYQMIDASSPAAFSSTIIDGYLRGETGYDGVVTSDSLSATALSGIPVDQLGVRLVEAGGDLACVGALSYVQPILDGLLAKARTDADFARKVTRSAIRVMTLKYRMGLAG